ncbi:LbFV_orf99-like [Cotesia congregata filamentous virus 1]|uniref:LbFV_orf99-like n=1 Tax=Cotesia congregata filamentous virus 1 TaxID=3064291 RepID=A0ABC8QKK8_9VIRU|nr:LbFV_orf99-like [Cotesia congregata filamentous virus 1]
MTASITGDGGGYDEFVVDEDDVDERTTMSYQPLPALSADQEAYYATFMTSTANNREGGDDDDSTRNRERENSIQDAAFVETLKSLYDFIYPTAYSMTATGDADDLFFNTFLEIIKRINYLLNYKGGSDAVQQLIKELSEFDLTQLSIFIANHGDFLITHGILFHTIALFVWLRGGIWKKKKNNTTTVVSGLITDFTIHEPTMTGFDIYVQSLFGAGAHTKPAKSELNLQKLRKDFKRIFSTNQPQTYRIYAPDDLNLLKKYAFRQTAVVDNNRFNKFTEDYLKKNYYKSLLFFELKDREFNKTSGCFANLIS